MFRDVTNVLGLQKPVHPSYTFERNEDNTGFATTDGLALRTDGANAIPLLLDENQAVPLPTLGFIIEF